MDEDEVALSDVHLTSSSNPDLRIGDYQACSTNLFLSSCGECRISYTDDDGDFVLPRKIEVEINIEHAGATKIKDVGLQVWPGCLLLCDFVLSYSDQFKDKIVVELGAGLGLSSLILSSTASHIFSTDIGDSVLELCQKNISKNLNLMSTFAGGRDSINNIRVKEYDWLEQEFKKVGKFGWSSEDIKLFESADIWIMADVFYDNHLTDALFDKIRIFLHSASSKSVYMSVEKRLNFTLSDLDVSCPAYVHFRKCLQETKDYFEMHRINIQIENIDTSFPENIRISNSAFKRNKYLEMWKISSQHTR